MSVSMRNYSAATTPPSPAKNRILIMLKLDCILTYSAPNLMIQEDTAFPNENVFYIMILHSYIPRNRRNETIPQLYSAARYPASPPSSD
jgi:hypothetical protein